MTYSNFTSRLTTSFVLNRIVIVVLVIFFTTKIYLKIFPIDIFLEVNPLPL